MDPYIVGICTTMLVFQEKNSIKNECMANVQYLYDSIKMSTNIKNVVVKAVMVASLDSDNLTVVDGHLVIELDNHIIDPSYDVCVLLKNKRYFYNIKNFLDSFNDDSKAQFITKNKHAFDNFLKFVKIADKINSGACMFHDKVFYNAQADYVDKMIKFIK
jgi:hypothetical protein